MGCTFGPDDGIRRAVSLVNAAPRGPTWHNARMKLRTATVFGIGYLLGARAGRDRYEQLRRLYRRVTSNERVRQVVDQGKDIVDSQTSHLRDIAAGQLRNAGSAIRERTE
jgi:hypothetical protein